MKEQKVFLKSKKGQEVEGILHIPKGNRPFPAIIMVHGYGGEGVDPYFVKPAKELCKEGFVVLNFLFSAYNTWPDVTNISIYDELEELELAIDFLEKQDNVNKNKICIFAQSLGCVIATLLNDSRIKVMAFTGSALNLKPVFINLFTKKGISELEEKGSVYRFRYSANEKRKIGIRFWNEIKKLKDVRDKIKSIKVPIIFFHGEKDNLIPISTARELFKLANKPKKFVQ